MNSRCPSPCGLTRGTVRNGSEISNQWGTRESVGPQPLRGRSLLVQGGLTATGGHKHPCFCLTAAPNGLWSPRGEAGHRARIPACACVSQGDCALGTGAHEAEYGATEPPWKRSAKRKERGGRRLGATSAHSTRSHGRAPWRLVSAGPSYETVSVQSATASARSSRCGRGRGWRLQALTPRLCAVWDRTPALTCGAVSGHKIWGG